MAKKEFVRVEGTVMWAFLNKINTTIDDTNTKYDFKLTQLSPKDVAALESLGITTITDHPENGKSIIFKSKFPIEVLDETGNKMSNDNIGNGSRAIVTAGAFPWKFGPKRGMSATCLKLVITDLKIFTPDVREVEPSL